MRDRAKEHNLFGGRVARLEGAGAPALLGPRSSPASFQNRNPSRFFVASGIKEYQVKRRLRNSLYTPLILRSLWQGRKH